MLDIIKDILNFMIGAYAHAWPYLLLTIPLAVIVNISGLSRYIGKAFSARPLVAIVMATAIGAFSPFCSCGVIPVITSLLIGGVPLAPVMSFWLASPSMDPEVFFLSVSQVGMDLAIWRLAGTFAMSLGGGFITHYLVKSGWLKGSILRSEKSKGSLAAAAASVPQSAQSCCGDKTSPGEKTSGFYMSSDLSGENKASVSYAASPYSGSGCSSDSGSCGCSAAPSVAKKPFFRSEIMNKALKESKRAVFMILKFMTLAFFLEALIILYLPEEWITSLLGSDNRFAIPMSTLIGIPLYTTNLTALGLIGGLLKQGMNPGGALAFLIAGATTTIPAMAAVFGIVRTKVFAVYMLCAMGASVLAGYLFQIFH